MRSPVTVAVTCILAMSLHSKYHIPHKRPVLIVGGKSGDVFTQLGAISLTSAAQRLFISVSLTLNLYLLYSCQICAW